MKAALIAGLGLSLTAMQSPPPLASPAPLALWRLDCGEIRVTNLDVFSDSYLYEGRQKTLTDSCYLIRHGNRFLLWDTGLPQAEPTPQAQSGPFRTRPGPPLREQLARIGVASGQITFVGISHYHGDHTGQAADFPGATLLVGAEDWDSIRGEPPAAARFRPWISGDLRSRQSGVIATCSATAAS